MSGMSKFILDAMRNDGAVLHYSLVRKAGKSQAAREPTWELYQNGSITSVRSNQVQALIKRGVIVGAGDSLFPDIVHAQTWRANKNAVEDALDDAAEEALGAPAKHDLRWKERGENCCRARASRIVGGVYIIAWEDIRYDSKYCSRETIRKYSVSYSTREHGPSSVSWLMLSSLEDAKALAQLDFDKRTDLISRYGDKHDIPTRAWEQFRGDLRDWQLQNNRERIAAEIAARKQST